jgi:hypothetical protein
MQTYRDIAGDQRRSANEFVSYNLTREDFEATYTVPMLPVKVDGLEQQGDDDCRAPLLASQQVNREPGSLHGTGLYKISVTGYSSALAVRREGHNVFRYPAIPPGL